MRTTRATWLVTLATAMGAMTACKEGGSGPSAPSPGVPQDVSSVIFLQRAMSRGVGNVFDYTHFVPGGRLVKLEPPSPDGKLTVLTSDPMFTNGDVMAWDLSFDAKELVFAARTDKDDHFQLFMMNVDGANLRQLTEGPYHHVFPIFLPGGKIMFTTSKVVEEGAPQFADEYERQMTTQVGIVNRDGSGMELGPRNVSHRVSPALLPDGHVLYTEWRHLGTVNDGHLRLMNTDMTGMREAFGGEDRGVTNSYLKARYVDAIASAHGTPSFRLVTVATSRERTLQAGKLILIDLNGSEKASSYTDLTPLVPGGNSPSANGVGRYYDAEVIGDPKALTFLASWSDGPVQSEVLEMAKTDPNFGLYILEGKTGRRFPLWDDPAYWDVMARPVTKRAEPQVAQSPVGGGAQGSFVLSALNVYSSTAADIPPGSVVNVRLLEGFSGEEGFSMFGTTEFDGQSRYGEVPVEADGSFKAEVPANVPLHMQLVDKFAMAIVNENIWISGRAGEERTCGGCHEDRAKGAGMLPGGTFAQNKPAHKLDVPRPQRVSMDFSFDKIRGVPWDLAIQPIFDAKCVSCHNGDATNPANSSYTVIDKTLGTMQTFTFDLRGDKLPITVGEKPYGDFSASYISMMGLGEMLGEDHQYEITGDYKMRVAPGSARDSAAVKKLNPPQRFPANPDVRAFSGKHHPLDVGGTELTADEYYRLILNIDMGGQFFFRENRASY